MRSLFVKTLLWFLATTAVAITGITVTTALTFRASESRQSPFSMMVNIQLEDAKRAYETYLKHYKPLGYKIKAQVMDFPGGKMGEIALFLSW